MAFTNKLKRVGSLISAVAFVFAIVSAVTPASVSAAYANMGTRYIQMSNTANGATGTYKISFTTVTTGTVGSVVVEFCSNNPIIDDSCTPPDGINVNEGTVTIANQTGTIGALTIHANTTTNRLVLTTTAASAAAAVQTFEAVGITNPTNTNQTFFVKLSTHVATTGADANVDAGGVALSTDNFLSLTAKVQETLTFCVYTGVNCVAGGTAVVLGDTNGVLSSTSTQYTDTAGFDLASNAVSGVAVKLKGTVLTSGSNTITSSGTTCTADSVSTSVEQFGLRLSAIGSGQTASTPYDCSANSHSFDTTNTNTTYGQDIATTDGATDVSSSTLEFTAKAAGTTEAGVYTSTLTLIATATY